MELAHRRRFSIASPLVKLDDVISRSEPTQGATCFRVSVDADKTGARLLDPHGEPIRIDAGWPGSLKRLPVSVTFVPSTLSMEMS